MQAQPPSTGERYFGLLHCYVIEGEAILHSWLLFRRKKKVTCWDAEACIGKADPYCAIHLATDGHVNYRLGRTPTVTHDHYPKWRTEFSQIIDVPVNSNPRLDVRVLDADMGGDTYSDVLGQSSFPLGEIIGKGKPIRVSLSVRHPLIRGNGNNAVACVSGPLPSSNTRQPKETGSCMSRVKIEFRWYDMTKLLHTRDMNVPQTYFRRSHGNLLRLYHDAECLPGQYPEVYSQSVPGGFVDKRDLGATFRAHSAWHDLYDAINDARHFVFVAGWSVNPAISLRRDDGDNETIGELLKRKAQEGVSVCVIVWDDITSREGVSWLKDGLMATYDEYTREYFRNTKVEVAVAKRIAGDDAGEISDLLKWTSFSHHQKIVCYDAPMPSDSQPRRIIGAFVGGLDLTSGRYDTAAHSPFNTLNSAHKNDFYNGCLVEATAETGPREPWHDIHARVLGPAAWDILQTFIERVSKQAPKMVQATAVKIAELRDNQLLKDGRKVLVHPDRLDSWDIQVFRSLDSEAALFENSLWTARFANPTHFVDRSIQQAYAYIIRKAQHFLYIENQYFLGSSQFWHEHNDVPCHNIVPWLIAERICEAIRANEDFCAYILVPLFPEGAPGSASVQEILQWQYQTISMMYGKIAHSIKEAVAQTANTSCTHNSENKSVPACRAFGRHPTDYLSFFFCGVREMPDSPNLLPPRHNLPTDVLTAIQTRRHPIYIHSKLMIVDDEFLILGSANINERSLNGSRDTEIAIGCIQPHFRTQIRPDVQESSDVSLRPPILEPVEVKAPLSRSQRSMENGGSSENIPPPSKNQAGETIRKQSSASVPPERAKKFPSRLPMVGIQPTGRIDYARGDVRAFRLQLWHEHLGSVEPEYEICPESMVCMRRVRDRARENWQTYVSPELRELPHGHLCIYPLHVSQEGNVDSLKDYAAFPGWPGAPVEADAPRNPYKILGVSKNAPAARVKKAFRALSKTQHPDRNPNDPKAAEKFSDITWAYEVLTNDTLRAAYDRGGEEAVKAVESGRPTPGAGSFFFNQKAGGGPGQHFYFHTSGGFPFGGRQFPSGFGGHFPPGFGSGAQFPPGFGGGGQFPPGFDGRTAEAPEQFARVDWFDNSTVKMVSSTADFPDLSEDWPDVFFVLRNDSAATEKMAKEFMSVAEELDNFYEFEAVDCRKRRGQLCSLLTRHPNRSFEISLVSKESDPSKQRKSGGVRVDYATPKAMSGPDLYRWIVDRTPTIQKTASSINSLKEAIVSDKPNVVVLTSSSTVPLKTRQWAIEQRNRANFILVTSKALRSPFLEAIGDKAVPEQWESLALLVADPDIIESDTVDWLDMRESVSSDFTVDLTLTKWVAMFRRKSGPYAAVKKAIKAYKPGVTKDCNENDTAWCIFYFGQKTSAKYDQFVDAVASTDLSAKFFYLDNKAKSTFVYGRRFGVYAGEPALVALKGKRKRYVKNDCTDVKGWFESLHDSGVLMREGKIVGQ